uniref:Ig-like domain-containing protein n=1 Tax=Callorhinchus milii TaxID=7868 RepID=A0A4W3GDB0_CALMI
MLMIITSGVCVESDISQSPQDVTENENGKVSTDCSTTDTNQALQWYRQYPNQALRHLVKGKTGKQQKERITATMNYKEKGSNLSITGTEVTDAATYVCALETQ